MERLRYKVIWIMGAATEFGEALAAEFGKYGTKIILSSPKAHELYRIQSNVPEATIVPFDLSNIDNFEMQTEEALRAYGHIDTVVYNAGMGHNALAVDTLHSVYKKLMDVNFFSCIELTRQLLPHFIRQNSGHIAVVSSIFARVGVPNHSGYCAAKAALHGYFDSLRAELLEHNIDVTMLVSGFMQTKFLTQGLDSNGVQTDEKPRINVKGCSVSEAAEQTVKAIVEKKYEVYIGNQDEGYDLLQESCSFPSKAIDSVLNFVKDFKK